MLLRSSKVAASARSAYVGLQSAANLRVTQLPGESSDASSQFSREFDSHHIRISPLQRALLGVGSAAMSLCDPARGDMIATMGEATGERALKYMREKMLASEEGSQILRDQPRINSRTVDLDMLSKLETDTVGRVYYDWLKKNKVSPDSRLMVQFVDDAELAYVMQRYREIHDLVHAVLFMPTNMLGEVTVKWVEGIQTGLPMCLGGALFGALRLAPKQRKKYVTNYLPWAVRTGYNSKMLMNVYFEKRWEQPISEFHKDLNIQPLVKKPSQSMPDNQQSRSN